MMVRASYVNCDRNGRHWENPSSDPIAMVASFQASNLALTTPLHKGRLCLCFIYGSHSHIGTE